MTWVLEGWYVRGGDAAILVLFASLLAFLGLVRRGRRSLRSRNVGTFRLFAFLFSFTLLLPVILMTSSIVRA